MPASGLYAISTPADLAAWHGETGAALLDASLDEYEQYLARLTHTRDYLDEIVASSSEALTQLSELTDSFTSVVGETQALSRQSRTYIDAMERGQRLAAEVQDALSWYDKYDGLARKINMPNVLK